MIFPETINCEYNVTSTNSSIKNIFFHQREHEGCIVTQPKSHSPEFLQQYKWDLGDIVAPGQ